MGIKGKWDAGEIGARRLNKDAGMQDEKEREILNKFARLKFNFDNLTSLPLDINTFQ